MTKRIYNFSSGPAMLPECVLTQAQEALWSLGGSGIGVMEHSHRGPELTEVLEEAESLCRQLAGIPDDYSVLFLQGGASLQFAMVPMNLLGDDQTADYLCTGTWSQKAIKEARLFGSVHVAASSEDDSFTFIPAPVPSAYSAHPSYIHFTSNNTIYGTQFATEPVAPAGVPLICDASSDLFSRPIDIGKYGLIYAGAQKNLGPSGLTLVILRKELADRAPRAIPTMLQYRAHIAAGSRYNTPPTLGVFVLAKVLGWLRDGGGLEAIAEHNQAKAKVIYDYLDDSRLFYGTARPDSRSLMNICFRAHREGLEAQLVTEAQARGFSGLQGHRSAGGMRASIYNAFPREGCDALVAFMKEFEMANR